MKLKLLPIKPFQETLHASMCGPASLKMVLDYYGLNKTEQEVAELCRVDKDLGIDDKTIKQVAKSLGFKVNIKNSSSFEEIQKYLDKKIPVIVNWFTRGRNDYPDSEVADGHYSVVVGLDNKYIYLQDPEIGKMRKITKDDFRRVWFDFTGDYINNWSEIILRQMIAIYR